MPERARPGDSYTLEIVLTDPALQIAGFLLAVTTPGAGAGAGALASLDATTEVQGTKARSTLGGALPRAPGSVRWKLVWTAPAVPAGSVRFEVWTNAGNDDLSPLGDRLHRRTWQIPVSE